MLNRRLVISEQVAIMFCDGKFVYEDEQENQRQNSRENRGYCVRRLSRSQEGIIKRAEKPRTNYRKTEEAMAVIFGRLVCDLPSQLLT
jgi:hypothetical protein